MHALIGAKSLMMFSGYQFYFFRMVLGDGSGRRAVCQDYLAQTKIMHKRVHALRLTF